MAPVNPEIRIKQQVDRLTKELNLTPDQASKITDIQKKYAKKEIKRYEKAQKKWDARMKKHQAPLNEMKVVLTADQAQKLDSLLHQPTFGVNRGQGFERMQAPKGGFPAAGRRGLIN